ncbi:unnamed protein product [Anisakis simplex]|uniref:Oxidoreductase-like domain-containing protein n=1 Tax=Anisakis simplex TaxID=6269 RepID=A0A0M3JUA3_ANISI|nr:unnamed protein product [Anisakis simplex]
MILRNVSGIIFDVAMKSIPKNMQYHSTNSVLNRTLTSHLCDTTVVYHDTSMAAMSSNSTTDTESSSPSPPSRPPPPPPPPPPEPEFSCVSTRSVQPRRAFTGSHVPEPPDPLTCCGSGCPDCVWIQYGVQLMNYYSEKPIEEALRMIDDQIPDICMREFVKTELRAKKKNR